MNICIRTSPWGDLQDGGGVRRGDHLPPHRYIKNTSACGTTPTEYPLMLAEDLRLPKRWGTDALRRPTCRGRTRSRAEHQELRTKKRKGNYSQQPQEQHNQHNQLHNQLDVPCICGIPEWTMNHPKIEVVDFGSNCRLGVCFCI